MMDNNYSNKNNKWNSNVRNSNNVITIWKLFDNGNDNVNNNVNDDIEL